MVTTHSIAPSRPARKLQSLLERQLPKPLEASDEMAEPRAAAAAAGLRYVSDLEPGIRRRGAGTGFSYVRPDGGTVSDDATLKRIRALAIPPAYRDVWICRDPIGHLQASGRDARGRKQYRYHERWHEVRNAVKFDRMQAFGGALPRIRRKVAADLRRPGLPREKVLAAVVAMLEQTLVRVGNEEYRDQNHSYGLTTLGARHVDLNGNRARFRFNGKSGRAHDVTLDDPRLVRVVQQCLEIPGYHLFQWVDDEGERRVVDSGDVNQYLREISGDNFTAKDFRTWAGTVLAARLLRATKPGASARETRDEISGVIKNVAAELRNTPAVCRKCYVHPAVIDAFIGGYIQPLVDGTKGSRRPSRQREEIELLELLRHGAAAVSGEARIGRKQRSRARSWRARRA